MFDISTALAPSQAARRLGLSKTMICLLCRQGKLEAVKTPIGWLVNPGDVERLRRERAERKRARARHAS